MPDGHATGDPSPWIVRFAGEIARGGCVLDVAAGGGRHTRFFLERGHPVVAIDRVTAALTPLLEPGRLEIVTADLEDGTPWPLWGRTVAAVVVTNYLHRPLFPALLAAIAPGGLLLYETFAEGNQRFGKPSNPAFLLRPGELLEVVRDHLEVLAYEHLTVDAPRPSVIQRIAARRPATAAAS